MKTAGREGARKLTQIFARITPRSFPGLSGPPRSCAPFTRELFTSREVEVSKPSNLQSTFRSETMEKVAVLDRLGCDDKIAWSRNGSIAYAEGSKLRLCYMASLDGEKWGLQREVSINHTHPAPLRHIAWSNIGSDLACIDVYGDITVYAFSPPASPACLKQPSAAINIRPVEYNQVVGFKWLDLEKPYFVFPPPQRSTALAGAAQNGQAQGPTKGSYNPIQTKPLGPFNPGGRQGCIAVTRDGTVKLVHQTADSRNRYVESVASLGLVDLITHASFVGLGPKTFALLAYIPSSKSSVSSGNAQGKLRLYTIELRISEQQTQAQKPPEGIVLDIKRIKEFSMPSLSPAHYLTHFMGYASTPYKAFHQSSQNHGTVFTGAEMDITCVLQSTTERASAVIQKYELRKSNPQLNNAFLLLSSGKQQSTQVSTYDLILKGSKAFEVDRAGVVLSAGSACFDTYEYFAFSTGRVLLSYKGPPVKQATHPPAPLIYSLFDVGYNFMPPVPNNPSTNKLPLSQICLSPNILAYVFSKTGESKLGLSYMVKDKVLPPPLQNLSAEEMSVRNLMALASRHAASCFAGTNGDDILAVMQHEYLKHEDENDVYSLLSECYGAAKFSLDLHKDILMEKVVGNNILQRLLALQLVLGTKKGWKRSKMADIALCTLNLRLLGTALMATLKLCLSARSPGRPLSTPTMSESEVKASYFLGVVPVTRWCTDIVIFMYQELYLASLEEHPADYFLTRKSLTAALMLSRVPRFFLIYILRILRALDQMAANFVESDHVGAVTAAQKRLSETISMAPVQLPVFEKLVNDIDGAMRNLQQSATNKHALEHDLFFEIKIDSRVSAILTRVVTLFVSELKPNMKLPEMYLYDVSWLGLGGEDDTDDNEGDEKSSDGGGNQSKQHLNAILSGGGGDDEVDFLKKTVISKNCEEKRRCVRCGGVSAWDEVVPLPYIPWTAYFRKQCLCGGIWVKVEE